MSAEEVVLQLKWKHQFQFAGYYAAIKMGYYREAGLDVRLVEGGPGLDAITEVVNGRAQYGVSNSQVLLHRIKGQPLVVLAAIFQHSPLVFVARKDTGIATPQDMIGRAVKMTRDSRDVELQAALLNEGVSLDRINIIEGWVEREDYFNPKVDAASAYVTNEPYYFIQDGVPYNIISPLVYGIDFYGDCLITSEKELAEHPDRATAFREASLKGWEYAMTHPGELIEIIRDKYQSEKSLDHLQYEAEAMRRLILPRLVEMGHMNPGRWRHIADIFVQFGWIAPDYSLDGFMYDPNPWLNVDRVQWIVSVTISVILLASLIILTLIGFNRRLAREVAERRRTEGALRESEGKFRSLFELSPQAIALTELKSGKLVDANKRLCELTKYTKDELIGRTTTQLELYSKNDRNRFVNELKASGRVYGMEMDFIVFDGSILNSLMFAVPFEIEKEAFILTVFHDVTEQKRLEAQLRQSQKMEAVGTLAGGIAHDFNNILQAISGYIELLLTKDKKDQTSLRHLSEIDRAVQRAAELVQQLLTFSRKVDPELKPVNLNDIVRQSVKMLERTIPKMIGIEIRLDDDLKAIKSDPIQMEQVLMNIGANAMDAMPQGGQLVIATKNATLDQEFCNRHIGSKAGDYVCLSISDTGYGMEEETIKHIFDPFYTTKEIGRGTGLGLAMVYGIVKTHDGYIICDSKPGRGTTFSIYLPVSRTESVSDVFPPSDPGVIRGGDETVLLVDDDEAVLEIAADILRGNGYTILTADCGEKALRIHEENTDGIDLVILDLGMPGMGGQGCLEKLLTVNPGLKVIIASGYSADAQVKDALDYGAKDSLGKPYRLVDLLKKVRQVLDGEESSVAS